MAKSSFSAAKLRFRRLGKNKNRLNPARDEKSIHALKKARLLIFDDFGLQPITHPVKLLLLPLLEDRYERAGTIIVSQLPVAKWHDYIAEPTIADAILDRIVPKAHRIKLQGDSLRKPLQTLSS